MQGEEVEQRGPPIRLLKNSKNVPDAIITLINTLNVNMCKECKTRYSESHMSSHGVNLGGIHTHLKRWLREREEWEKITDKKLKAQKHAEFKELKKKEEAALRELIKDI